MLIALVSAGDGGDLVGPNGVWRAWSAEPGVIVLLLVAAAVFARAAWVARERGGRAISPGRIAAFIAGWTALAIALVSPIDRLGETLFAGHMAQHLLLIVVAAPLLVVGAPPAAWLWALPLGGRRLVTRTWLASPRARAAAGWVLRPSVVLVAHTAALWFWHFPRPYQAALEHPVIHVLEHASFLGTALLFWWVVLQPAGRRALGFGASILYVGVTLCQSGALGALLMFSAQPWYPLHAAGDRLWGLTPLADQQLAGLIMWIPAGAVYVGAVAVLFVRWMRTDERAMQASERVADRAAGLAARVVTVVALLALGGLVSCSRGKPRADQAIANSDPARGREAIARFGCGSCHDIPGIRGAAGMVGPPLTHWSQRRIIAGEMENTPDHLITWITMPQAVEPGTAMPNMGISDGEARDIAAYLYSIR